MEKKMKIALILITIGITIGIICIYWQPTTNCTELENQIQNKIISINYCNVDDDCVIKNFGCPFSCGSYINKNSDSNSIEEQIGKYRKLCGECKYKCLKPLEPLCINNKCSGPQCELNIEYNFNECECPEGTRFSEVYNEEKKDWFYVCKVNE